MSVLLVALKFVNLWFVVCESVPHNESLYIMGFVHVDRGCLGNWRNCNCLGRNFVERKWTPWKPKQGLAPSVDPLCRYIFAVLAARAVHCVTELLTPGACGDRPI